MAKKRKDDDLRLVVAVKDTPVTATLQLQLGLDVVQLLWGKGLVA